MSQSQEVWSRTSKSFPASRAHPSHFTFLSRPFILFFSIDQSGAPYFLPLLLSSTPTFSSTYSPLSHCLPSLFRRYWNPPFWNLVVSQQQPIAISLGLFFRILNTTETFHHHIVTATNTRTRFQVGHQTLLWVYRNLSFLYHKHLLYNVKSELTLVQVLIGHENTQ